MGPMKGLRPGVKGMAKYAVSLAQPVGAATTYSASFRRIYRCAFALFELLSKSLCQNRKDYEHQGRYMEQGRVNKWRAPVLALGMPLSVSMVSPALALGNDQDYSNHFAGKAKSEELVGKDVGIIHRRALGFRGGGSVWEDPSPCRLFTAHGTQLKESSGFLMSELWRETFGKRIGRSQDLVDLRERQAHKRTG